MIGLQSWPTLGRSGTYLFQFCTVATRRPCGILALSSEACVSLHCCLTMAPCVSRTASCDLRAAAQVRHRRTSSAQRSLKLRIYNSTVVEQKVNDAKFSDFTAKKAFLFPGQGAQYVGMAKEICVEVPKAKEMFEQASDILGYNLLDVCIEGAKDKLDSTVVSQPAIYVASLAAVEKLRATEGEEALVADVCCGLSLGEYTALAFAGAMSFEDGLRLVKLRGESMQAAADAAPSGMVSVIGLNSDKVKELCEAANKEVSPEQAVQIANYLCNGNYAVSGGLEGCAAVEKMAKDFKARMTVKLAVAGAFHTRFMQPAVERLNEALVLTTIVEPKIPVISNVDAAPHADPDTIKAILGQQVTSPVQWETTMKLLIDRGLENAYEIGPGKVIAGILKRVDKKIPVTNISA